MGQFSRLFENPAVGILEEHLWEAARKRYLGQHPDDRKDGDKAVRRKVISAYKDEVAATLKEADHKVGPIWRQFKQIMTEELKVALATVLRMSEEEWYAVEVGELPHPDIVAVPYELLKRTTTDVMSQFLKKLVEFENLDDLTLEALATYAADQKFAEILEEARRNYEPFKIGNRSAQFVVTETIQRDAYFLGDEKHHSLIDMVILSSDPGISSGENKEKQKTAVKRWLGKDRNNRNNDRRFTGDGWDIEPEELKSWAKEP
jgi:hypothetical protein